MSSLPIHIILLLIYLYVQGCQSEAKQPFIAVNNVGYQSGDPKEAMLINAPADSFEIVDITTDEIVFEGLSAEPKAPDLSTGDSTATIDFSEFSRRGNYIIRIKNNPNIRSQNFSIDDNLYKQVTLTAIQSYYYARCGSSVDNGEPWKHSICHTNDGVFYADPSKKLETTGGWHDAGDYNKYAINTELSVGLLLYLFEIRPDLFEDGQLNIPESQNGIPDLLDEVRWTLEWLMKIQDKSGGIYHKVSQKEWVGEFLPQDDPETRYIFRVSSNATGGFAAVAALGARLFQQYDAPFAARLGNAALNAWGYLERNPVIQPVGGFTNPPDVIGGEYGDSNDTDVRLWSAIELYKLTEDLRFLEYFINTYQRINIVGIQPLSWKEFNSIALVSFLDAYLPPGFEDYKDHIISQLKAHAQYKLRDYRNSNFKTLLRHTEYYWGSNSVALGYGYLFTSLYRQTGDQLYYQAALDQLHYNLGRNPFGKSFVTGVGANSVEYPYHQFSMELDYTRPVPGMLVGGPNNYVFLNSQTISEYPAKNYEDNENNYYVNEVAINWTAILAYMSGFFATNDEVLSTNMDN